VGGRVALQRWTEPQDHLFHPHTASVSIWPINSLKQRPDRDVIWAHAAQRVKSAGEYVVHAAMQACRFDTHEITRLLQHENATGMSVIVGADSAGLHIGELPARLANRHVSLRVKHGGGQCFALFARRLEKVKRQPRRRPLPDARKPL
jgi:hypothetical protein